MSESIFQGSWDVEPNPRWSDRKWCEAMLQFMQSKPDQLRSPIVQPTEPVDCSNWDDFFSLANLAIGPKGVMKVCRKHGSLFRPVNDPNPFNWERGGMHFWSYIRHKLWMDTVLETWRAIRNEDESALIEHAQLFVEPETKTSFCQLKYSSEWRWLEDYHDADSGSEFRLTRGVNRSQEEVFDDTFPGSIDLITAARAGVMQVCNHFNKAPVLLGLDLKLKPPQWPIESFWYNLSLAISEDIPFERCLNCTGWFHFSHASAKFCSTSCRTTFADKKKRRQEKAKQLRSEGMSLRKIAAELETDLKTVKAWLD